MASSDATTTTTTTTTNNMAGNPEDVRALSGPGMGLTESFNRSTANCLIHPMEELSDTLCGPGWRDLQNSLMVSTL